MKETIHNENLNSEFASLVGSHMAVTLALCPLERERPMASQEAGIQSQPQKLLSGKPLIMSSVAIMVVLDANAGL